MNQKPNSCFLTHFSRIMNIEKNGYELLKQVGEYVTITQQTESYNENHQNGIREKLFELLYNKLAMTNQNICRSEFGNLLSLDLSLNAQGLEYWNNKVNTQVKDVKK